MVDIEDIYLCDIDGTLSDYTGLRGPYDEHLVHLDKPLPTVEIIKSLMKSGNRIIYFSGRTSKCHKTSSEWIEKYIGEYPELYMREIGDNRADDIVKEELYNTYIKGRYKVLGVFDDRLKVCRMWYKLGLFVFNCNQGLKEF
jgi:hypothetical protein